MCIFGIVGCISEAWKSAAYVHDTSGRIGTSGETLVVALSKNRVTLYLNTPKGYWISSSTCTQRYIVPKYSDTESVLVHVPRVTLYLNTQKGDWISYKPKKWYWTVAKIPGQ